MSRLIMYVLCVAAGWLTAWLLNGTPMEAMIYAVVLYAAIMQPKGGAK